MQIRLAGALVACVCASAFGASPSAAQGSYSPYDESPTVALGRYVRTLASDPKDFEALIGAGKSALELGDAQAAAGFFARADEVDPRSPLPQAGMGAVAVANGEAQAALPYFKRAQQLGAPLASFACDRGLAYDLLGRQSEAQADYRVALATRDGDEARRRLVLSLAISGDRANALQTLAPLSARGDAGVARVRAFVLALTGDANAAANAINAVMPGSASGVAPFLRQLPTLGAGQKAAAVNLGIVPGDSTSTTSYASANVDRLSDIDALLSANPSTTQTAAPAWQARPVQVSYARPAAPAVQRAAAPYQSKICLQLASGQNVEDLSDRFRRLKKDNPDLFDGIKPYLSRSAERARLLVGPFKGASDASIFADDLKTVGIDAFRFTNSQTDRIAPLAAE
jgi:Flp pilus assembly protein TadD